MGEVVEKLGPPPLTSSVVNNTAVTFLRRSTSSPIDGPGS